jgi:hypothetical protein
MRSATVALVSWVLVMGAAVQPAFGQAITVFTGLPVVKISEAGTERKVEQLPREQAANLSCVVSQIAGKYYWATRANKELVAHTSGAFVTYVAVDGSGYVRAIIPSAKAAAAQMSPTETNFDYTEHLVLGLRSVTYYGTAR